MAPSHRIDYFTFAGMQQLLRCSESDVRRLELAVKNHVRGPDGRYSTLSCQSNWRAIETSDPIIKALLKGYLHTGEKTRGEFREDIESMKSHLYARTVAEFEDEQAKAENLVVKKPLARKRVLRWDAERDQDDEEPIPKKIKVKAKRTTESCFSSDALHPTSTRAPQGLEELLKSQAQKSASETTKAVEAHIEAAMEERVNAEKQRLKNGIVALTNAESRLKKGEADLAIAQGELLKKTAKVTSLGKWEERLNIRENSLEKMEKVRADYTALSRALKVREAAASTRFEMANEKEAKSNEFAATLAKAVEDFQRSRELLRKE